MNGAKTARISSINKAIRKFVDACLRRANEERYVRWQLRKLRKKVAMFRNTNPVGAEPSKLYDDFYEFDCWLQSILDTKLLAQARKFNLDPDFIEFERRSYADEAINHASDYMTYDSFGNDRIRSEFRKPLRLSMQAAEKIYRKEQREKVELYIKLISALGTSLAAVIGSGIGLLAFLKK